MVDTSCCAAWQDLLEDSCPYHNVWADREPWDQRDINLRWNFRSMARDSDIAVDDSGGLYVAFAQLWYRSYPDSWRVSYTRSTDRGATWTWPLYIQPVPRAFAPRIASWGQSVYSVWASLANDLWRISGAYSSDRGRTWSAAFDVTSPQSYSAAPALAANGDTLFVAWQDLRDGNWDVFFTRYVIPVAAAAEQKPAAQQARLIVPNPCRVPVTLRITGWTDGEPLSLAVFDPTGRPVRTVNVAGPAVAWDGRNDAGSAVLRGSTSCDSGVRPHNRSSSSAASRALPQSPLENPFA